MASTFGENKKLKHNQTPSRSWNNHIGLEKSNTCSLQLLSRNTKRNSKSDKSTDLSTTDQGNGEDTGQEGKEPIEDSGPDHRLIRSDWNEFYLVSCDKCDYFYAPQAFVWHLGVRHPQPLNPSLNQEPSIQQHRLYKKKPKPTRLPEHEKKGKIKNGKKNTTDSQNKRPLQTDDSKNDESEANSVDKQAVTSGPGPGQNKKKTKKKKGTNWTRGKKSQKIVLENCEGDSLQIVTENFIKEPVIYQTKGSQNCVVDVESLIVPVTHGGFEQLKDGLDCVNFSSKNLLINQHNTNNHFYKTLDVFSCNNNAIPHTVHFPPKILLKDDDPRNKLNCHPDNTSPINCSSNMLYQKPHNGPSKIFNENLNNAQRNNSVICGETRNSSFQNENNAYLKSVGDGSELSSRKCIRKTKPGVKLKRQRIKEKLKTALDTQCLQTIKLEPMKIKKALSSINRVCRARTIEQFRTFSHLKRIMPSGKNSPHRTRVSCSVNTGAKSACINTWNKVPFRYEPRKSFFPLGGGLQADSGVVLSDSSFKTLRATFIQDELVSSPIQFQVSDFVTTLAQPESDLKNGQPNYELINGQPDSVLVHDQLESNLMDCHNSNLVNDQPESNLMNVDPNSDLTNCLQDYSPLNVQPDSGYLSQYEPDSTNKQHLNIYSPISSPEDGYEKTDEQHEDSPNFQEPGTLSKQIICIYQTNFNINENQGYYREQNQGYYREQNEGYYREQNQGCTDR